MDKTQEKRHRIKLLAVDMDGTCLDGRSRMSRETVEALREAARAGARDRQEPSLPPSPAGGGERHLPVCHQLQRGRSDRLPDRKGPVPVYDPKGDGPGTSPGLPEDRSRHHGPPPP